MTASIVACALMVTGAGALVAGIAVLFGYGWALVAGGLVLGLPGVLILRGLLRG